MPKHRLPHWLKRTPGRRALIGAAAVVLVTGGGGTTAWALTGGDGPQVGSAADAAQAPQRHQQPRADRDQQRKALPKKKTGSSQEIGSSMLKAKKADPDSAGHGGGTCEASNYGAGSTTASGEPFDSSAMAAAHKTLPFGTKLRVTNTSNGDSVVVKVNDRGPFVAGRCLDLTTGAFSKIASAGAGVAKVHYTILSKG